MKYKTFIIFSLLFSNIAIAEGLAIDSYKDEPYESVVTNAKGEEIYIHKEKTFPSIIVEKIKNVRNAIFGEPLKSTQKLVKNGGVTELVEEITLPTHTFELRLQKEMLPENTSKYKISTEEQEIINFVISSPIDELNYNQVIDWKKTSMTMSDLTFWVVQHNYKQALHSIISLGVIDVNLIRPETLLHSAVLTQDIDMVNMVLEYTDNTTLNDVDSKFKENALFKAVVYGPARNSEIMRVLMSRNINPNIKNIQSVPMISKIISDPEIKDRMYDDLIYYCLARNVTLKDTDDRLNMPIHFAASYNPTALQKLIPLYKKEWINDKTNISYLDIQNIFGNTPAMEAVKNLNPEALTILIKEGANLKIKNKTNQSIMDIAIKANPKDISEADHQTKKENIYKQLIKQGF